MEPRAYVEMAALQDKHWWFVARRRILAHVLSDLSLPQGAAILEIGCGTGGNLGMLSRFGVVSAVEMDEFARAHARQISGLDIRPGRLPENIPFPQASFDLVCLFDVLEHVAQDRLALQALRPLVRPAGKILITVPAHPWLWSAHDEELHHYRRYTAKHLVESAQAAGWQTIYLTYFNTLFFPVVAIIRLFDRWRKTRQSTGTGLPNPPINKCLQAIFASEARLLALTPLPFGVSLLAVMEPKPA
jgi:SAM-dependent methyltransferase